MKRIKKWRPFPRSLRQLVLMAFLLVLLPLLVLAWQAWESLSTLSDQAVRINRTTLADVRRSEAMARSALEQERSYRQYCVLQDPTLAQIYQMQREKYALMLGAHTPVLPDKVDAEHLQQLLGQLSQLNCLNGAPVSAASDQLDAFSVANARMVKSTREAVFSRGVQLQREIASRGQYFGWQALILFLLSLGLVLLFTRMIIGPVKSVKHMINQLGEGRSPGSHVTFSGPREIRSLGQRILWLSKRLAWLEAQRHEFLRHISHELKTPLASMREGTALLADQIAGPLTPSQQEVVMILDSSSRHLQTLIEQLLDYNRQHPENALAPEPVALDTLMNKVIAAHALSARAKHLHTDCDLQVISCLADPALLMRVIDNLYSNAVHYGRESGNIWLRSFKKDGRIMIDVANTGTPIPVGEQTMIFEPFFQGRQQRKGAVKGSGLGLSIAKECLHRMQGDLQLVTSEYADVCFRIILNTSQRADQ